MRNELTVVTAIFENVIGFGLLEVVAADFLAGNLCGNGQHRYAIAMAIVQAIDEVRVPWSAAAGTHREIASKVRLSPGRKRGRFLIASMYPRDRVVCPNRIRDPVQ